MISTKEGFKIRLKRSEELRINLTLLLISWSLKNHLETVGLGVDFEMIFIGFQHLDNTNMILEILVNFDEISS